MTVDNAVPNAPIISIPQIDSIWGKFLFIYAIAGPFLYLTYHGWACVHLLDTDLTDRLAFRFFLAGGAILLTCFILSIPQPECLK